MHKELHAISQFNTAEENKVAALNAKNATAIADANAQRQSAINQFNLHYQIKDKDLMLRIKE